MKKYKSHIYYAREMLKNDYETYILFYFIILLSIDQEAEALSHMYQYISLSSNSNNCLFED